MRKTLYPTLILSILLIIGGAYTANRGYDARDEIRAGLAREQVTVSADIGDVNPAYADQAGKPVDTARAARAQAAAIWGHTMKATGGKTYATVDRFVAADGTTTSDAKLAKLGADGKPVPNPARNTAMNGAFLRTGLMLSVASFGITDLVVGLGWAVLLLGALVAVGALAWAWRKRSE